MDSPDLQESSRPRIAFLTISVLKAPMGDPVVQDFVDRVPSVFDSAENSPGFIDRSRVQDGTDVETWGAYAVPEFLASRGSLLQISATLSLWESLEAVAAYAYRGAHGEALSKRSEWFQKENGPGYAAWWVEFGHIPNFQEASERWSNLHEKGPTAFAFDFKQPFDPDGRPGRMDRAKVMGLAAAADCARLGN